MLPICKLLFPNGSYCNGVCRALWACLVPKWLRRIWKILFSMKESLGSQNTNETHQNFSKKQFLTWSQSGNSSGCPLAARFPHPLTIKSLLLYRHIILKSNNFTFADRIERKYIVNLLFFHCKYFCCIIYDFLL